ncbi:hypothetical protein BYT27DRAFT_7185338 [Phlegmacium glaucopus]|nr:hypothetical protein BYT27DRAFT_7185338 [Phlegmacium glaucopus]
MAPQHSPQPGYPPTSGFNNRNTVNDFTKGMAQEVRYLLSEIGKLRDQRRQLQYEIAELMAVRTKFSEDGEFQPEWKPPAIEAPPPVPAPEPEAIPAAKPAWRVVSKRPERKARTQPKAITAAPTPTPAIPEAPKADVPAWAQWRPNPLLRPGSAINSPSTAPAPIPHDPPPRSGLFGPSTPPPK